MADVPVLVCTAGELSGRRIPVPEGGLGIGRSDENALVIDDDGVSRYHGRLLFENGSLWLQDAGSRNGVFVNGVRVTGHKALKVGDAITIARHTFELRWQEDEHASPSDRPASSVRDSSSNGGVRPSRSAADSPPASTADTTDPSPRRRWYWPFS